MRGRARRPAAVNLPAGLAAVGGMPHARPNSGDQQAQHRQHEVRANRPTCSCRRSPSRWADTAPWSCRCGHHGGCGPGLGTGLAPASGPARCRPPRRPPGSRAPPSAASGWALPQPARTDHEQRQPQHQRRPAAVSVRRAVDQLRTTVHGRVCAEGELHAGLAGLEDVPPFLHRGADRSSTRPSPHPVRAIRLAISMRAPADSVEAHGAGERNRPAPTRPCQCRSRRAQPG